MPSSTPAITSRADVRTDAPARYAKQLVAHLSRKLHFTTDGATSTATIGDGTGHIITGEGVLTLLATGDDESAVARVEHVLGSHLERFGRRNELIITWTSTRADVEGFSRVGTAPASSMEEVSRTSDDSPPVR
jgi:uncharacterized protein